MTTEKNKHELEYEDYFKPSMVLYAGFSILCIALMAGLLIMFGLWLAGLVVSIGATIW